MSKESNTGKLIIAAFTDDENCSAQVVEWKRCSPHAGLLAALASKKAVLLYPSPDAVVKKISKQCRSITDYSAKDRSSVQQIEQQSTELSRLEHIILIDGTWQEARKIYNKSIYLKNALKLHLITDTISRYHLRRNQKNTGLCTAEIAMEMLSYLNYLDSAVAIERLYTEFLLEKSSV
ncbi:MAG: hypothetical protein OFPII_28410 [Osedax symbiont Rs1]|nr:MAG: hypothetical protein OFPII_28410 [Osedax symbiont Rs1]